jgi:hypothetical protein
MNCRIDLPRGEVARFSPNLEHVVSLLSDLAPTGIEGVFSFRISSGGMALDFVGSGDWDGCVTSSAVIPRWMFCELAFRELLDTRVESFMDALEELPTGRRSQDEAPDPFGILPRWSF